MATEETAEGTQYVAPFYKPPSPQERLQRLLELPYSHRNGRADKAKPLTIGLFDVEGRSQLDLMDILQRR